MFTASKTILEVDTIPQVEIDFMNTTHFEEINMVKKLGEVITLYQEGGSNTESEESSISKLLQDWLDHTVAHFERENKLMQETGFPAYTVHSDEHEIALNKMKAVTQAWQQNKDIELVSDYIFTLWPNWFNGHVNSMDMMTAKFAIMNGFNPHESV